MMRKIEEKVKRKGKRLKKKRKIGNKLEGLKYIVLWEICNSTCKGKYTTVKLKKENKIAYHVSP